MGARRQPLLTSIFCDEIYLPSLLTDTEIGWFAQNEPNTADNQTPQQTGNNLPKTIESFALEHRIEEFLVWQYYLSRKRFEHMIAPTWAPIIGLPDRDMRPKGFVQASYKKLKDEMKKADNGFKQKIEKEKKEINWQTLQSPLHTVTIRYTDSGEHLNEPRHQSNR